MMEFIGIGKQFLILFGKERNEQVHRHYSIQLLIPTGQMELNGQVTAAQVLVNSNVKDIAYGNDDILSFLINPESNYGQRLKHTYFKRNNFVFFNFPRLVEQVKTIHEMVKDKEKLQRWIEMVLEQFVTETPSNQQLDGRVTDVVHYIQSADLGHLQFDDVVGSVYLSKSRLTHLFKDEMGISLMRYMTWTKLLRASKALIFSERTITEVAHKYGFADAAHLSREFKENFGFSPKRILLKKQEDDCLVHVLKMQPW
ncbi:helix-turn-helix transcriptional regulator [Paenibacillus apiarius]|uniref:helix-turn-helix transcriptional regulator n=1 Tax=Paenibacillus apiarius TaxID=46240 RepID=UPI003B3A0355